MNLFTHGTLGILGLITSVALGGCAEQNSGDLTATSGGESASESEGNGTRNDSVGTVIGSLVINEVVAKGADGAPDWIELYNGTGQEVSLDGYAIQDDNDDNFFQIPSGISIPSGAYYVIEGKDSANDILLPFGIGGDDAIRLIGPDGEMMDMLDWEEGEAPEGQSYGRYPDGGAEVGTLQYPSYGATNTPFATAGDESAEEGETETTGGEGVATSGEAFVNEVSASSADDAPDWVEFYNPGTEDLDLSGWSFTDDDPTNSFVFPAGTAIPAGGYLLVEGKDSSLETFFDFGLGKEDAARLQNPDGVLISSLEWLDGEAPNGLTFGRSPDGSNTIGTLETPTPEAANSGLLSGGETEGGTSEGGEEGTVEAGVRIKISEIMYNPDAVDDDFGEWFELYNAGTEPVDLRDLEISDDNEDFQTIEGENPLILAPGQYAVLGNSADVTLNGDYIPVALFSFKLGNGGDTVIVRSAGVELDRLNYGDFASAKGTSLQQSTESLADTALTGTEGLWCLATMPFGDGDLGTPGAANSACESSAETSGGEEEGGESFGDPSYLMITEFMVNPAAVEDNQGEWFEITNTNPQAINLSGLIIADAAGEHVINEDVIVEGDTSIVIARSSDPALNGGIENVLYVYTSIQLNNGADSIILKGDTGIELDRIDYDEDAGWPIDAGVAVQLDAALAMGPGNNNDPASWCAASASYGLGDLGTPGEYNPPCGTGGEEGSQGGEEGGESGGGSATGKIYINEIMAKSSDGEDWIELFNSGTEDKDLSGWVLEDDGGNQTALPEGTIISGPGYLYIEKGDTTSAEAPTFDFGLGSDDSAILKQPFGEVVDVLNWADGEAPEDATFGRFPDGADASGTLSAPTPGASNVDFADGAGPEFSGHICDDFCGEEYVGELGCFCDSLCFSYGDCCNPEGTQFAAGCGGSTCGACQPPSPCCTAGTECGNNTCETCVCATQPSCCAGVWDASCSALANESCSAECSCE